MQARGWNDAELARTSKKFHSQQREPKQTVISDWRNGGYPYQTADLHAVRQALGIEHQPELAFCWKRSLESYAFADLLTWLMEQRHWSDNQLSDASEEFHRQKKVVEPRNIYNWRHGVNPTQRDDLFAIYGALKIPLNPDLADCWNRLLRECRAKANSKRTRRPRIGPNLPAEPPDMQALPDSLHDPEDTHGPASAEEPTGTATTRDFQARSDRANDPAQAGQDVDDALAADSRATSASTMPSQPNSILRLTASSPNRTAIDDPVIGPKAAAASHAGGALDAETPTARVFTPARILHLRLLWRFPIALLCLIAIATIASFGLWPRMPIAMLNFPCDAFAAAPWDDNRPTYLGKAVNFRNIGANGAIRACSIAAILAPREGRIIFQFGRAYHRLAQSNPSDREIKESAEYYYNQARGLNYAAAFLSIGLLQEQGQRGTECREQDTKTCARASFKDAADRGLKRGKYCYAVALVQGWGNQEPDFATAKSELLLAWKWGYDQAYQFLEDISSNNGSMYPKTCQTEDD
jgi:hypothetical protein